MVKPGYKETEAGVIPKDWEAKPIQSFARIAMCKRIFAEQTSEMGEIPFYKIGTFGKEADAYIPRKLYLEYREKFSFPQKGDILISAAGTLGRTVKFDGKDSYFQDSNIVWLDIDKEQLCNEYLYQYYRVIKWASSEGSTISRLYNGIIYSTYVTLPPLQEQKKIAKALSDMDELIASLEKLIAKKKAVKQGAMQELLTGKKRLPGFDGEWKSIYLLSICQLFNGLTYTPNDISDIGTLVLRSSNIKNSELVFDDNVFVTCPIDSPKYIKKDDIVICVRNGSATLIGKCAKAAQDYNITFGAFMAVLRGEHNNFVFQILQEGRIQQNILKNSGATINQITNGDFRKIKIKMPPTLEEQQAIASILSDMDAEIKALEQKLAKCRQTKRGMMQQLLTGKIRLV